MDLATFERLGAIGGIPLIVIVAQWLVIMHLYRRWQVEHSARLRDVREGTSAIAGLLRERGSAVGSLPDFADDWDDEDTGVIDGRYSKVLGAATRRGRRLK